MPKVHENDFLTTRSVLETPCDQGSFAAVARVNLQHISRLIPFIFPPNVLHRNPPPLLTRSAHPMPFNHIVFHFVMMMLHPRTIKQQRRRQQHQQHQQLKIIIHFVNVHNKEEKKMKKKRKYDILGILYFSIENATTAIMNLFCWLSQFPTSSLSPSALSLHTPTEPMKGTRLYNVVLIASCNICPELKFFRGQEVRKSMLY